MMTSRHRTPITSLAALLVLAVLGAGQQSQAADQPVMSGQELYTHWCADCHDPGAGHPATLRMTADLGRDNAVLLTLKGINKELVKSAVRNGFQMMPPFRPTEITDSELARLADFLVKAQ